MPERRVARERALRVAIIVAGLAGTSAGCARVFDRVVEGTATDGTPCVGWSLAHGSAASCCSDSGGAFDPTTGDCDLSYGVVEGPFVPPADPRDA